MSKRTDMELLDKAIEITVAAVGASGEKSGYYVVKNPEDTAAFIQAVFDKLKEINDSLEG